MVDGATSTFILTCNREGTYTSLNTLARDTVLGTMNLHRSLVNVAWCDGDEASVIMKYYNCNVLNGIV